MRQKRTLYAMNRGIISKQGLARVDLDRTNMSAEVMTNWMPRLLGSMQLRAGWERTDTLAGVAKMIPFVYAQDDTAQIEFTDNLMRVRINDELITYQLNSASILNGNFDTNLANWTNADEAGATSTWATGGYAALLGTGTTAAILRQTVAVGAFAGVEHALRIAVQRGPIILRVGSTVGGDDYIEETALGTGSHWIAFTPSGSINISVMNRRGFTALLDSVLFPTAAGPSFSLPTPYTSTNFESIRRVQSNNVIFLACKGIQQRRIERRGPRSWSFVLFESETGPFRKLNATPITLAPSALTGDITIAASKALFKATHVGALFRIESAGQQVTETLGAADVFSSTIRVVGVGGARSFSIIVSGTFSATITLQYSIGAPGTWVDAAAYTAPTSTNYDDGLDNQEIYYRIGIKTGDYVSGSATVFLIHSSGSITGIARITAFTSSILMSAVVLSDFGSTVASENWYEGAWSDFRGWPSSVCIYESRLCFGGNGIVDGSISDLYEDFDDTFEGDAGPIRRTIGEGPQERIPWLLALNQLMIGVESSSANVEPLKILGSHPLAGRSSSFDEPLTPTNFNLKTADAAGMYVDTTRSRLLEILYKIESNGYAPDDLTVAVPDLNSNIRQIVVQYKPELRVYCRRYDGTAGVMIRDRAENLICWVEIETGKDVGEDEDGYGHIVDISTLPGDVEDRVYLVVRRILNGSTVHLLEKVALESECRGRIVEAVTTAPVACLADCFVRVDYGVETSGSIFGPSTAYLEGVEVCVWGWNTINPFTDDQGHVIGRDLGTYPDGSFFILPVGVSVTNLIIGIPYTAQWKSSKLAFAAAQGTSLNIDGKVHGIGLVLSDFHARGLQYGPTFEELDEMPLVEDEEEVDENRIWEEYDQPFIEFDGDWTTDQRICLQAASPRPCTVLAIGIDQTKSG